MSEKKSDNAKKKSFSKVLKFFFYLFLVVILIAGTIFVTLKISGSRTLGDNPQFALITKQLSDQNRRLEALEELPESVSTNTKQLASTAHMLSILNERFNQLYEEIGDGKVEHINKSLSEFNHRIAGLEELKSTESLILSVALLIKENVSSHRFFVTEADILSALDKPTQKNAEEIEIISRYKDVDIADNSQLANRFSQIMENFSFSEPNDTESKKETTFSKSIKTIKDTVSGMHFDRVIVLKKKKKTEQQQKLLDTLSSLVNANDFRGALEFIEQNQEFSATDNKDFTTWKNEVKEKLLFDEALAKLIANQLQTLRQDIKNSDFHTPVKEEPQKVEQDIPLQENAIND